ncbi:hypothetical protein B0H13DRAFT_1676483, partial [Mycena leptocephala]
MPISFPDLQSLSFLGSGEQSAFTQDAPSLPSALAAGFSLPGSPSLSSLEVPRQQQIKSIASHETPTPTLITPLWKRPVPPQFWQPSAQQPTCTNLRIRSVEDAHKIFFAICRGILRMVSRRLDSDERAALRTGCVYAWEERSPNTEITGIGIERFTEGRRWSPSRVRDEFLFYYEKWVPDSEHGGSQPIGWEQLVKQTYSVWVETERGKRKWHLTAYFTQTTVDRLGTVDDIPDVHPLEVPAGMFTSTRTGKRK